MSRLRPRMSICIPVCAHHAAYAYPNAQVSAMSVGEGGAAAARLANRHRLEESGAAFANAYAYANAFANAYAAAYLY